MRAHRTAVARLVRPSALLACIAIALGASAGPSLAVSFGSAGETDSAELGVEIAAETAVEIGAAWADDVELDTCPPRCSARTYSQANPSEVYEPVEPDEWVFDAESQVVWGHDEGQFWLIWGGSDADRIVLWDDTMWVDPGSLGGGWGGGWGSYVAPDPAAFSPDFWIPRKRPGRANGRPAGAPRVRVTVFGASSPVAPPELELPDQAPTPVWTHDTRSQLVALIQRISKSRYAVAGLTLGIVWLMLRLVR